TGGPAGTTVSILGANLTVGGTNPLVTFNSVPATIVSAAAGKLVVTVPATATTGKIAGTTAAGTRVSDDGFTVAPKPTITGFTPTAEAAGYPVVITGTNFVDVISVSFGGTVSQSYTVDSPTQITATVPVTTITGKVTVVTPGGIATSAGDFTPVKAPTI